MAVDVEIARPYAQRAFDRVAGRNTWQAAARAKRLFLTAAGARMAERTAQVQADVVALMSGAATAASMAQVQAAMTAVSEQLQAALDSGD